MWYVIQVKTGDENKIITLCKKSLMKESEEVFTPTRVITKRIKGIDMSVETLLFPGYCFFITEDIEDLFFRLKAVKELTKILRMGDDFVPLTSKEETFISRLSGRNHRVEASTGYIEGDRVIITNGPIKGLEGLITKINRHKKCAVLKTELFGRSSEITVGLEIVEKR